MSNFRSVGGGGPSSSVNPSNDAFAGGSRTAARVPTAVGGAFSSLGAAGGPPPAMGGAALQFARNDRGSNIRIPYARIVPIHNSGALVVDDPALVGTGRTTAFEYDGLQSGELAWIQTKQFHVYASEVAVGEGVMVVSPVDFSAFATNYSQAEHALMVTANESKIGPDAQKRLDDMTNRTANAAGMGHGVDRMQRLAYTHWVEALFKQRVGRQRLDLSKIRLGSTAQCVFDSEIEYYTSVHARPTFQRGGLARDADPDKFDAAIGGISTTGPAKDASIFAVPDIAFAMQTATPGKALAVPVAMMQGLFVMEQGPFLRSYGSEHEEIELDVLGCRDRNGRESLKIECDRHLGSDLAQRALVAEMKRMGILNWVPDGITLSKLENGPDSAADASYDARSGQLFNVGVQGPCITSTWCGNPEMAVLPMDKVFVLVVADLSYTIGENGEGDSVDAAAKMTKAISNQRFTPDVEKDQLANITTVGAIRATPSSGSDALGAAEETVRSVDLGSAAEAATLMDAAATKREAAEGGALAKVNKQMNDVKAKIRQSEVATAKAESAELREEAKSMMKRLGGKLLNEERRSEVGSNNYKQTAQKLRDGSLGVKSAEMTNFKLMRATSSFLSNTSHCNPSEKLGKSGFKSRCGLKVGYAHDGIEDLAPAMSGFSETIVGGWCVGTVTDAAASRAVSNGNAVRTAPSSMAINVNVNIEWWSAHRLWASYQDKDRGIYEGDGEGDKQKAQKTTFMRTQPSTRSVASVQNENSGLSPEAALGRLTNGEDDTEGKFLRPDVYGANTDPVALGQFDRSGRSINKMDERVWCEAMGVKRAAPAKAPAPASQVGS